MEAKTAKTVVLGFLIVVLLTLLGLYHVWQHQRVVQVGGDLAQASRALERLHTERKLLEAEFVTLRSQDPFGRAAFRQLGMKHPSSAETIVVEPESGRAGSGVGGRP
jgi:cell division protein FtsL